MGWRLAVLLLPPCYSCLALPARHFNPKLNAFNAFTVPIDEQIIDAAADLFESSLRAPIDSVDQEELQAQTLPCRIMYTTAGRFFLIRHGIWQSDICWVSADDDDAFRRLEALFRRLVTTLSAVLSRILAHEACAACLQDDDCAAACTCHRLRRATGAVQQLLCGPLRCDRSQPSY